MKLRELAERLDCRLDGDGEIVVDGIAGLEQAGPRDVTFLANVRYASLVATTRAAAILLAEDAAPAPCAMLRSANPYLAFARAVGVFADHARPAPGIHDLTAIANDVELGEEASIGPFVTIASGARLGRRVVVGPGVTIGRQVVIGDDCEIRAHASIRDRTSIGCRVIVHDGAVIGSDGFGFAKRSDGTYEKIPQPGVVVIEDDVEIGANTTIDRPAIGETRIRAGTKIDNLVQVAHGVTVGRNSLLCAQVGIAGSARIGDDVVLAGQVGVAGHLEIGDRVVASAQTGIPNSVEVGQIVSGTPAIPNRAWLKASASFKQLPEMRRTVADLQARLAAIERRLSGPER